MNAVQAVKKIPAKKLRQIFSKRRFRDIWGAFLKFLYSLFSVRSGAFLFSRLILQKFTAEKPQILWNYEISSTHIFSAKRSESDLNLKKMI